MIKQTLVYIVLAVTSKIDTIIQSWCYYKKNWWKFVLFEYFLLWKPTYLFINRWSHLYEELIKIGLATYEQSDSDKFWWNCDVSGMALGWPQCTLFH